MNKIPTKKEPIPENAEAALATMILMMVIIIFIGIYKISVQQCTSDLQSIAQSQKVTDSALLNTSGMTTSTRPDCVRDGDDNNGIITCHFAPKGLYITSAITADGDEMKIEYELCEANPVCKKSLIHD